MYVAFKCLIGALIMLVIHYLAQTKHYYAAGLVLMLFVATLLCRRRREEAVASPQPLPLVDARLLALTGLSADGLADARGCKRAVVRRTDAGGLIVEP